MIASNWALCNFRELESCDQNALPRGTYLRSVRRSVFENAARALQPSNARGLWRVHLPSPPHGIEPTLVGSAKIAK